MKDGTPALRGVLLDIDGTLIDSNDAHAHAWVTALAAKGHSAAFERVRPLIGKGGDKLLREIVDIDSESELGQQMSDHRHSVFKSEWLARLKATAGARELLEQFQQDGLKLVIATSASEGEVDDLLEQAGLADLIQAAASADDAEDSKPDPDIVQAALRKSGLEPHQVFMLGDTPYDVEAASLAGVRTVSLRSGGWWDDASLAGSAGIYDDPADLLSNLRELSLYRVPPAHG